MKKTELVCRINTDLGGRGVKVVGFNNRFVVDTMNAIVDTMNAWPPEDDRLVLQFHSAAGVDRRVITFSPCGVCVLIAATP